VNLSKANIQSDWTQNISNYEEKLALAMQVASFVKNNDVIGFGSGSTSLLAVREIAKRVKNENLKIIAIPTSQVIKNECEQLGIPTSEIGQNKPNWGFDGADEVDKHSWLIKGLGGALFKEKQVIASSPKTYILVDKSKFVDELGVKCPVPVECRIDRIDDVKKELVKLGAVGVEQRVINANNDPYITENGNYILDCKFLKINNDLEIKINNIEGVVDNGLFIGYNIEILR